MKLGWFARMLNNDVEVKVENENGELLFHGYVKQITDGEVAARIALAEVKDWTFHPIFPFVLIKIKA